MTSSSTTTIQGSTTTMERRRRRRRRLQLHLLSRQAPFFFLWSLLAATILFFVHNVKAVSLLVSSRDNKEQKEPTTTKKQQRQRTLLRQPHRRRRTLEEDESVKVVNNNNENDPKTIIWKENAAEAISLNDDDEEEDFHMKIDKFFDPFEECTRTQLLPKGHFVEEATPTWLQDKYLEEFQPFYGYLQRRFGSTYIKDIVLDPLKDFSVLQGSNPTFILWDGIHSHAGDQGSSVEGESATFPNPTERRHYMATYQVLISAFDDTTVKKRIRGARGIVIKQPPSYVLQYHPEFFNHDENNNEEGIVIPSSLTEWHDGETVTPTHLIEHQHRIHHLHEFDGNHVVFLIDFYDTFAHIVIDMLPFIAYLRETYILPSKGKTKLLLPNSKNLLRQMMEQWDPTFALENVSWIDCPKGSCENEMVHITGTLTVMHLNTIDLRHVAFTHSLRKWIYEGRTAMQQQIQQQQAQQKLLPSALPNNTIVSQEDNNKKYIIYYTRNDPSAQHGRQMDQLQEDEILKRIENTMAKYNRTETLIKFDGKISIQDQFELFQNAHVVIGPHGGGMANLMFLKSSECQERPNVLEFLNNIRVPEVQVGGFTKTYYHIYEMAAWVEYHHVLYHPPSNKDVTYIDLEEFQLALDDIFSSMSSRNSTTSSSTTSSSSTSTTKSI